MPPSRRTIRRRHARHILRLLAQQEDAFLNKAITRSEQERTAVAKADTSMPQRRNIDANHRITHHTISRTQRRRNLGYTIRSCLKRATQHFTTPGRHVSFAPTHTVRVYQHHAAPTVLATLDSGADGHYLSESDRRTANLPILRPSSKRVGVANGGCSSARHVTALPLPQLSSRATRADSFDDFPSSLISVGRLADDNTISIFTKDGVSVHHEHDVLISCRGEPILIGARDEHGRYRVPLIQHKGQWQPRPPRKRINAKLCEANNVYDLPSIEQGIRWMHAVCGYPVKSTWLKAVRAGNFLGWPLLTEKNIARYYPDTFETQKGHMNQVRKNVRSTKGQRQPFEVANVASLRGQKARDIFTSVYDVRETIFSDQTGQFPTRSQRGNKYVMVMVKIDSNAILLEPLKSRHDHELIRAYDTLMSRLLHCGVQISSNDLPFGQDQVIYSAGYPCVWLLQLVHAWCQTWRGSTTRRRRASATP